LDGGWDRLLLVLLQGGVDLGESLLGGDFFLDGVGSLSSRFKFEGECRSDELLHLFVDGCGGFRSDGKGVWRGLSSINRIGSVTGRSWFGGIGRGRCAQSVPCKWRRSRWC